MIADIPNEELLDKDEVIARIRAAVADKRPFALVRIGDGENFVLSQDSVYTMEQVLHQTWVKEANKGRKGVKLPNIEIRDRMVEAIKEADIVGVLTNGDRTIMAHHSHKRVMTNQIFNYFKLKPDYLCSAIVNRDFIRYSPFWDMLHEEGARLALVSRWAGGMKQRLIRPPYNLNVAFTLPFERYEMMEETLAILEERKNTYDVVLCSCGVNAVVLSHQIAKRIGKIGIDFGIGTQIISSVPINKP
ncbi:GT-D fold domain-containing glycosyltransferase [Paenibacillus sp. J5C_2022]|uniref:GT-D fold domain-containing glycosyltransferase n=1 Tax=Paenibacillus sp. J5C2022 TaxID=2977129 RepID=UPI0021CE4BD2|nr:GT-D fold domain-containing glycosyltransferase [Paenibacillus sp. J5C2022]MCU6710417.1 GT-D fold domain-containing glycosyltransferase [Paenibacillus sp. J5C2022]